MRARRLVVAAACLGAALLLPAAGPAVARGATCQGQPATITGTPGGTVTGTAGSDVIVTNGADVVNALGGADQICVTGDPGVVLDAGGGDDGVHLDDPRDVTGSYDGGAGDDTISVNAPDRVALDLGGTLEVGDDFPVPHADLAGFEDARARADNVQLDGTSGPNVLEWNSCVGTMTGGQGADRLEWAGGANRCRGQQERTVGVYGGKGDDRLIGSPWADVLVGGRGHDIAVGAGGVDRCRAEVERGCEQ
jgi:Ca2+-binding RTX toxin-like protein